MSRSRPAALSLATLLGAALAAAPLAARAESPYWGSFELRAGGYKPSIDKGITPTPPATQGPYQSVFGGGRPLAFKLHLARALPWRTFGTFEVGVGAGYWQNTGHGTFTDNTVSQDRTALKIVPTQLTVTWRLDVLMDRFTIPLVPYARASLERDNWWVTNGGGKTTKSGATNGYAYGGGLALVLDVLDPMLARELDQESGINHTMLTVDVAKTKVDDFGSKKSWDLSDPSLSVTFGLLFVF